MSTILYNTSSSLVPKFQRHNLLRQQRDLSPGFSSTSKEESQNASTAKGRDDKPFESGFDKNSDGYLRELCCSVYPKSLHERISKLDPQIEIPLQALMSLVWKNFVTSWYGVKISTSDDRFMTLLFDLVQAIAARLKLTDLEYELFIADDLPSILSEHLWAMRQCLQEGDVFSRYCQLTSYGDGYYPQLLTNCILSTAPEDSLLQSTFIQALFNELLLGKIMDRATEPYFALSAIHKLCGKLEAGKRLKDKQVRVGPLQRVKNWVAIVGKTIALMTSMNKPPRKVLNRPFLYINAFTFLFVDLLKLPGRKPFLYAMGKTLQYWSAKSESMNTIMQNMFFNLLKRCASRERNIRHICIAVRQALFPEDNKMGMGTIVLVGDEFEQYKRTCVEDIWLTICSFNLDSALGVNQQDVEEIIETICRDKRCNKVLIFKIVDCLLAHTDRPPI